MLTLFMKRRTLRRFFYFRISELKIDIFRCELILLKHRNNSPSLPAGVFTFNRFSFRQLSIFFRYNHDLSLKKLRSKSVTKRHKLCALCHNLKLCSAKEIDNSRHEK